MPTFVIALEPFERWWPSVQALAITNWKETDWNGGKHDGGLNEEVYRHASEMGSYLAFIARDESDTVVGYSCFWVSFNAQCKDRLDALADVIYIAPEYRSGNTLGRDLLIESEKYLTQIQCDVLIHAVRPHTKDWSPVLQRMGYTHIETLWAKPLPKTPIVSDT